MPDVGPWDPPRGSSGDEQFGSRMSIVELQATYIFKFNKSIRTPPSANTTRSAQARRGQAGTWLATWLGIGNLAGDWQPPPPRLAWEFGIIYGNKLPDRVRTGSVPFLFCRLEIDRSLPRAGLPGRRGWVHVTAPIRLRLPLNTCAKNQLRQWNVFHRTRGGAGASVAVTTVHGQVWNGALMAGR